MVGAEIHLDPFGGTVQLFGFFVERFQRACYISSKFLSKAIVQSADGESMLMPLNKIERYIGEGSENSTHYFVAAELSNEE
jgi:hypothetical protein